MTPFEVLVIAGQFGSEASALAFCADVYDDHGDSVRSPLASVMGWEWADTDFVEVAHGSGRFEYLRSLLTPSSAVDELEAVAAAHDTLVLVFLVEGNAGLAVTDEQVSAAGLRYCGRLRGAWG